MSNKIEEDLIFEIRRLAKQLQPLEYIAIRLNIPEDELRLKYKNEIKYGRSEALSDMSETIKDTAQKDHNMLKTILKVVQPDLAEAEQNIQSAPTIVINTKVAEVDE